MVQAIQKHLMDVEDLYLMEENKLASMIMK